MAEVGIKSLLLYDFPENLLKKNWILLKVFIKEGILLSDWGVFTKNRKVGGSLVIPDSLSKGLKELEFDIAVNDYSPRSYDVVVVIKNCSSLEWAIKEKRAGRIKTLIAGPFIATFPYENKGILYSPEIDGLLFLSEWHRRLFLKNYLVKPPHSSIWYSGVDSNYWKPRFGSSSKIFNKLGIKDNISRPRVLIYIKAKANNIYPEINTILRDYGLNYSLIEYGSYTPEMFKSELEKSDLAVFISQSETQGIALLEAWSMDVPTLVWNPQCMKYFGQDYQEASSCPYLNDSCGVDFLDLNEFKLKLNLILQGKIKFSPRAYVLDKFTLKKTAQLFINIIKDLGGSDKSENLSHHTFL